MWHVHALLTEHVAAVATLLDMTRLHPTSTALAAVGARAAVDTPACIASPAKNCMTVAELAAARPANNGAAPTVRSFTMLTKHKLIIVREAGAPVAHDVTTLITIKCPIAVAVHYVVTAHHRDGPVVDAFGLFTGQGAHDDFMAVAPCLLIPSKVHAVPQRHWSLGCW